MPILLFESRINFTGKFESASINFALCPFSCLNFALVRENPESEIDNTERTCPRCKEGELLLRKTKSKKAKEKHENDEFIGCSRYAKSRYTESVCYLMAELDSIEHIYGFDRELRASLKNMKKVKVFIPSLSEK